MSNDLNFYINGEWVKSDSNELIDVINPANEEVIGQVTAGTKEDIDAAVNAASNAFVSFSKSSQEERIDLLKKIIQEYENRYKDFVEVITKEMGAPNWLSERAQANTGLINFKETLEALRHTFTTLKFKSMISDKAWGNFSSPFMELKDGRKYIT